MTIFASTLLMQQALIAGTAHRCSGTHSRVVFPTFSAYDWLLLVSIIVAVFSFVWWIHDNASKRQT